MKFPKVIKRDGTTEKFDSEKIKRIMRAAGMTEAQTDILVKSISAWTRSLHASDITSVQVRDAVLDEMKKLNKPAAGLFEWYQQTKESK